MWLPLQSLPIVCLMDCLLCVLPVCPPPPIWFQAKHFLPVFFFFILVKRASLVSSYWVKPTQGRQLEEISMATDVYRAPEMRHRVGERHFSIWDGVRAAAMLMPQVGGQHLEIAELCWSLNHWERSWAASCRVEKFGLV